MFASMVLIYWPAGREARVMRGATTSSRPDPGERLSAGGVAVLLVFAAVTFAPTVLIPPGHRRLELLPPYFLSGI